MIAGAFYETVLADDGNQAAADYGEPRRGYPARTRTGREDCAGPTVAKGNAPGWFTAARYFDGYVNMMKI